MKKIIALVRFIVVLSAMQVGAMVERGSWGLFEVFMIIMLVATQVGTILENRGGGDDKTT